MPSAPNYWDYLKLDSLLDLQTGFEPDEDALLPDELHFIIVHQAYELWFKLVLRSLRLARDRLVEPRVAEETIPHVVHHLRRVNAILSLGVEQFRVMETLTPQDFLAFRDKLSPASGFQSFQMREMEILIGLEDAKRIRYGKIDPLDHIRKMGKDSPAGRLAWARIEQARSEQTILHGLDEWLFRTPIQGSQPGDPDDEAIVTRFIESYLERADQAQQALFEQLVQALGEGERESIWERFETTRDAARAFLFAEDVAEEYRHRMRRVRAGALFIESYRELPLLSWPRLLLDVVVEMEEQLVLWRHRHARMVERLIGRRVGTGGSGGVEYLDRTTSYRVFRDLWAVRAVLLPKQLCPPLERPEIYGFASP